MISPLEHPDLHAIPLDRLHLSWIAYDALDHAGARSVGDLLRRREAGLPLGEEGDAHLSALLAACDKSADGGSLWPAYCAALGIPVLSLDGAREGRTLLTLFHTAAQSLHNSQTSTVLIRFYGLDGSKPMPYPGWSSTPYMSRYWFDRHKASGLYLIHKTLRDDSFVNVRFRFSEDLRQGMATLHKTLRHWDRPVSEAQLDARLGDAFSLTSVTPALRRFLAAMLDLEYRHPTRTSPRLWVRGPAELTRKIPFATRVLRHLLMEEEPLPLDGDRLLAALNARLAPSDRLAAGELSHLLSLLPWVEQLPDGRVQARLHTLRGRANQAVRILSGAGTSLNLRDIAVAMQRAHVPGAQKVPGLAALSSQFYRDKRLVHIGYGRWTLWSRHRRESGTPLQLIDQFFTLHGKPAGVDEVHAYVSQRRHVRKCSIGFFLRDRQRYQAFGDRRFGLLGWPSPAPEESPPSVEESAFIASFFPGKLGARGPARG